MRTAIIVAVLILSIMSSSPHNKDCNHDSSPYKKESDEDCNHGYSSYYEQ